MRAEGAPNEARIIPEVEPASTRSFRINALESARSPASVEPASGIQDSIERVAGAYAVAMTDTETTPLARALGRVPSGLFIVTTEAGGAPLGFLASFVMQAGFDPPTVSVAVAKGRAHLDTIRASGRFAVSILDAESAHLMRPFFRKMEPGRSPFGGLATERTPGGSTVLSEALAWLDCRRAGEYETGDHVVVFGEILDGALMREGEPRTHTRKDGLGY